MNRLTEQDYRDAANLLKTGVAEIKTVAEVESSGEAFDEHGRLIIRFEGHVFRKLTKGVFDKDYPTISHPYFSDGRYNKGSNKDYTRLAIALKLDTDAALKSVSWGMFQLMGFNFIACGYNSVHDMVEDFKTGERAQLLAFCHFVKASRIDDELQRHDWRGFAFSYNGKGYEKEGYHNKLARAFAKWNNVAA